MNYNKFKRSVQDLKMPDDMKKRIISNCERISENKAPSIEGYEEHYHFTAERVYPHPIRKALSVAAACALIVGGIGGTTYLISRNGSPNNEFSNTEENYKISPFGDFRELDFFIYEFEFNDQQRIKIADYLNNCDWKMINAVEGKDTRLSDVTFDSNDEEADSEIIEDTSESNDDTVYLDNEEVYCTIGVNTDNNSDFAITVYQSGISEVSHKENRSYLELYEVNITEFSNEINRILNENSLSADSFWGNVAYILTPEKTEITEEQREFLNKIWNESVIQPISEESFVKSDNILFTIDSEESESLSYSLIIYDNRNAELFKTENDISETISYYKINPSDLVVNINQMTGHSPVGDLRNMPVSKSVRGEAFTAEMSSEKKEKLTELLDSLEWKLSETQYDSFLEEDSWLIDFGTFKDSVYHNYMTISDVNGGLIKVLLYGKVYSYDIDFDSVNHSMACIFYEDNPFEKSNTVFSDFFDKPVYFSADKCCENWGELYSDDGYALLSKEKTDRLSTNMKQIEKFEKCDKATADEYSANIGLGFGYYEFSVIDDNTKTSLRINDYDIAELIITENDIETEHEYYIISSIYIQGLIHNSLGEVLYGYTPFATFWKIGKITINNEEINDETTLRRISAVFFGYNYPTNNNNENGVIVDNLLDEEAVYTIRYRVDNGYMNIHVYADGTIEWYPSVNLNNKDLEYEPEEYYSKHRYTDIDGFGSNSRIINELTDILG